MKEEESRQIARWIDQVVQHLDDEAALKRIAAEVDELCQQFPAPGLEHLNA